MSSLQIRLATQADAEDINDIYNHYVRTSTCTFHLDPVTTQERVEWLSKHNDRYPVLIATINNQTVGWASLSPFRERPAYAGTTESSVYIHKDFQRQGIAKQLMVELIERANKLGYRTILAGAEASQTASIKLHESLGFRRTALFKEVGFKFDQWLDTVFLQLMLPTNHN